LLLVQLDKQTIRDIAPETGKIYVAGYCIDLTNTCMKLPASEEPVEGDCFIEASPEIGG